MFYYKNSQLYACFYRCQTIIMRTLGSYRLIFLVWEAKKRLSLSPILGEWYKLHSSSLCSLLHSPCSSSMWCLFNINIIPQRVASLTTVGQLARESTPYTSEERTVMAAPASAVSNNTRTASSVFYYTIIQ